MQQRPYRTALTTVLSGLSLCSVASAEILCPASYQVDVEASPGANGTVGPGTENKYRSEVTAQLTKNKAICSVRLPKTPRFTVTYAGVQLLGNDATTYFSHPWQEVGDPISRLLDDEPRRATATQVTTATVVTGGGYRESPSRGLRVVFDCAQQPPVKVTTSAGTWHTTTAAAVPVDVTLEEAPSLRGTPRRFDISCHYAYPAVVSVEFPRQRTVDNRDVSTNLDKTGFYRVYDLNAALWKQVCARDCGEDLFVSPRRVEGLDAHIERCIQSCTERGW